MLFLPFSNSLLIINGVNQRPVSKSMFANLTTVLVFYLLSLSMCCTPNSDIDSSRSHPITNGIGQKRVRSFNDLVLLVFEGPFVPDRFEVVRVWRKSFCRHYFYLLQHQNCLATTDHATFGFYFSLAVLGSIGDKFGSINLWSHCSKSKFNDVFNKVSETWKHG